jgi:putative transposase
VFGKLREWLWKPYFIVDARTERVHEAGIIVSQAVLVAVVVELWLSSWRDFLLGLRRHGLSGVSFQSRG